MKTLKISIVALAALVSFIAKAAEKKIGIIGCDTSHTVKFAQLVNVDKAPGTEGFRVTVAYKWGSKDIFTSTNRYPKYIQELTEKLGVKMVDSIAELLKDVDCVLLETNDGRPHLEQALEVFAAGKPVFIDKPVCHDLADSVKLVAAAKKCNAKWFSASSLRYSEGIAEARAPEMGGIRGAMTSSPFHAIDSQSRYYWYAIHGAEPLFAMMGTGCKDVRVIAGEYEDIILGTWSDGRTGVQRAIHTRAGSVMPSYTGVAYTDKGGPVQLKGNPGYGPLVAEIMKFFRTGEVPVSDDEILEVYAYLAAAEKSWKEGGRTVSISEIIAEASQPPKAKSDKPAVVFVSAHPDDTEGFAGTAFLLSKDYDVHVIDVTRGERGLGEAGYLDGTTAKIRMAEERRAMEYLGGTVHFLNEIDGEANAGRSTAEAMFSILEKLRPVALFTHWPVDTHPDHVQASAAAVWARGAFRKHKIRAPEFYYYEVLPVQTQLFPPLYYVDITSVIDNKLELLRKYECQNPGDELAKMKERDAARRGAERRPAVKYAECFTTINGKPCKKGIFSKLPQAVYRQNDSK